MITLSNLRVERIEDQACLVCNGWEGDIHMGTVPGYRINALFLLNAGTYVFSPHLIQMFETHYHANKCAADKLRLPEYIIF